ncbi:hypothetical protein BOW53_10840 [Solemya pervernicosa gill symbiont]|uniref:RDD domain-containing protein n=1 Tax=Solemya pervernicosa gill symbiont TaxID=642797 RepID=A0A1T2L3G3_9GAMM|nr:hypothetical protein BOW53_10840 [Solemya pervernicosa gill symbiont]
MIYAGFLRRTLATLIDLILLALLGSLLLYLLDLAELHAVSPPFERELMELTINSVLPLMLLTGFWMLLRATPGKLLCDCQVVSASTGEGINGSQTLLRLFGYLLNIATLGLGFLWLLFDRRAQGLHDKLAGSVVVVEDDALITIEQWLESYR